MSHTANFPSFVAVLLAFASQGAGADSRPVFSAKMSDTTRIALSIHAALLGRTLFTCGGPVNDVDSPYEGYFKLTGSETLVDEGCDMQYIWGVEQCAPNTGYKVYHFAGTLAAGPTTAGLAHGTKLQIEKAAVSGVLTIREAYGHSSQNYIYVGATSDGRKFSIGGSNGSESYVVGLDIEQVNPHTGKLENVGVGNACLATPLEM